MNGRFKSPANGAEPATRSRRKTILPDLESDASVSLQDPLDLRATPRMAADFRVNLYVTGLAGPIPARVRDLSTTGACVATAGSFALKSLQRAVLSLPSGYRFLRQTKPWLGYRLGQSLLRAHATRLRGLFARLQNNL